MNSAFDALRWWIHLSALPHEEGLVQHEEFWNGAACWQSRNCHRRRQRHR